MRNLFCCSLEMKQQWQGTIWKSLAAPTCWAVQPKARVQGKGLLFWCSGTHMALLCARDCRAWGSRRAADLRAFCSSSLSSGAGLQQGSASRLVLCWLLATCRRLPHASIKAPHVMPSLQHSGHEPCRGLVAQLGPVPVCHQVRGKPSPRYGTQVVLHQSKEEQNTAAEEERHESTPFPCSCLLQWALETRKIKCICSRGT